MFSRRMFVRSMTQNQGYCQLKEYLSYIKRDFCFPCFVGIIEQFVRIVMSISTLVKFMFDTDTYFVVIKTSYLADVCT